MDSLEDKAFPDLPEELQKKYILGVWQCGRPFKIQKCRYADL